MDRKRLVRQIKAKGIILGSETLKIVREFGSGGNGVAFLCENKGPESTVAKVYIPPDSRDLDERAYKRFKNEISLISKMRHPNVIKALGSGTIQIGAYSLPFYTMPFAPSTLRQDIKEPTTTGNLEKKLRLFVRATLGVAALHSLGIVHRDLKPENILISKDGTPWVADLGIARVSSQLATTGVKTLASERLRNQDYYAPEQRFGSATDVDHRADIYALGCILYELILGQPPVRVNSPKLQTVSEAFAPLDPIIDRMTAFDPNARYPLIEDVLEDFSIKCGGVLAAYESGRPPVKTDLSTMVRLIRSSNEALRQNGIEVARRLGTEALDTLYELLGHARREVRNSTATALGYINQPESLPYLVGALYGITDNASRFRPSADTASGAIARFSLDQRLKALSQISRAVRPAQVLEMISGMSSGEAYSAVQTLANNNLILLDWGETIFEVLVVIDEKRTWPAIKKAVKDNDIRSSFRVKRYIGNLSPEHQIESISLWLDQPGVDSYAFGNMLDTILQIELPKPTRLKFLKELKTNVQLRGSFKDSYLLLQRMTDAIRSAEETEDQ
ncbi:MAG: protein kinase domain-containing protein [Pyrinomonadaceae bacterium]